MARFTFISALMFIVFTAAPLRPATAQGVMVDLELVFLVDASGSIDDEETGLQRQGYADALAHPRVLDAIKSGTKHTIAVAYIEFAGEGCERLAVPWTLVDGIESARAFGAAVIGLDRDYCYGGNGVGDGLVFSAGSIHNNAFNGKRLVIDISGDGPNTFGTPENVARDLAVARGITINALVIERPEMPNLETYFRDDVIGGPRAFVTKAKDRRAFARAILRKMILEIASNETPDAPVDN